MQDILTTLYDGKALSQADTRRFFDAVVKGDVEPVILASALTALKMRGETPEEIAGAVTALIDNARSFPEVGAPFADIVGTGGDGHNTINISSASAIVAAACGATVAKHGNRSVSSRSGSADLFESFGMDLMMAPQTAAHCLEQTGLCFLFAPNYHAGIRHAMPVRQALKTRTLFNLLGPLANPARPSHMLVGVYLPELVRPFAETLKLLGYRNALVVHGSGLDEFALHGPSQIAELDNGDIREYQLSPADFGLAEYPLSAIKGGEPAENKALIADILAGHGQSAHEAAVAMNTGALLKLLGMAETFKHGAEQAMEVIHSGRASETIDNASRLSQEATNG